MLDFSEISIAGKDPVFLVDAEVFRLYADRFVGKSCLLVEAAEENKQWATVVRLIDELMEREVDRSACLIGIGGGVVTDICGFVASIFKRGISFGFVPTTLLAMVDASLGGKNGINWRGYKNEVGIIRLPDAIWRDLDFLTTLPKRELYSGVVELLKVFLIADADAYRQAVELFRGQPDVGVLLNSENKAVFCRLVERAVAIKESIVHQDLRENNRRRLLNFGHTLAHAMERLQMEQDEADLASGLDCTHGEAVAWGICRMLALSVRMAGCDPAVAERVRDDFCAMGLSRDFALAARMGKELMEAIRQDKKREGEVVHDVLLADIGSPVMVELSFDELMMALEEMDN